MHALGSLDPNLQSSDTVGCVCGGEGVPSDPLQPLSFLSPPCAPNMMSSSFLLELSGHKAFSLSSHLTSRLHGKAGIIVTILLMGELRFREGQ